MENVETNPPESWQVEANGQTYEAAFDELTQWISEGALLRIDRVRKGNLRWIEAGKVPSLVEFFNAKDAAGPAAPVITSTTTEVLGVVEPTNDFMNAAPSVAPGVCAVHTDAPAAFICETCGSAFCKACPNSYGGTVKICPFCGAMCKSVAAVEKSRQEVYQRTTAATEGFGFGDFGRALAYPFRFKFSLFAGAVMFTLFSIGQGAAGFGGIFMLGGAIMCFMLSNMLTFGILGHTVDNFTQGKLDENFMPSFDDFSLWDDVVHPFFLSIGVYISSFGPLVAVILVAVFLVVGSVGNQMNGVQSDAARTIDPSLPYSANAVQQGEKMKEMVKRYDNIQKKTVEAINNGEDPPSSAESFRRQMEEHPEDTDYEALNRVIAEQRKAQLESAIGKTPETRAKEQQALVKQVMAYGALFVILGGLALLWGLFYFPAACTVAGYTRSFVATINPMVGFDTIKRLGSSYVLLLVMGFLLMIGSGMINGVLNVVFIAFDMPGVGNVPARAFGSFCGFYISVVFSCLIGFMLYKAADRLKLYR